MGVAPGNFTTLGWRLTAMRNMAGLVIAVLLIGCAAANPMPSSSTLGSHTPAASPQLHCPEGVRLPGGCDALEEAAIRATAALGYFAKSIDVSNYGWPCGRPFFWVGSAEPGCLVAIGGGLTAYVSFFGTNKVAALAFAIRSDGSIVATVVAFQVPPSSTAPAPA